jgi:hypothetical protein
MWPVRGDYAAGGRGGEENPRLSKGKGSFRSIDSEVASLYCPAVYVAQVSNTAHGTGPSQSADNRESVNTTSDH